MARVGVGRRGMGFVVCEWIINDLCGRSLIRYVLFFGKSISLCADIEDKTPLGMYLSTICQAKLFVKDGWTWCREGKDRSGWILGMLDGLEVVKDQRRCYGGFRRGRSTAVWHCPVALHAAD